MLYIGERNSAAEPEERLARHRQLTLSDLRLGRAPEGRSFPATATHPSAVRALFRVPMNWLSGVIKPKLSPRYLVGLEESLVMAGLQSSVTAAQFVAIRAGLTAALLLCLGPLAKGPSRALLLLAVGLLGWRGPKLWLKRRISTRQRQISKSLPDAVDLLTVSVEAGLGFDSAVVHVTGKLPGALGEEFRHFLRQVRMGTPRREALRYLGERAGVPDLKIFTTAIIQADQLGVSIGKVLRVQAEEIRRRRRQRAEEAAMKAPIKMLFPLIFLIFPALFVVLLGPAGIHIVQVFTQMQRGM
jgi:tight adherence protein C